MDSIIIIIICVREYDMYVQRMFLEGTMDSIIIIIWVREYDMYVQVSLHFNILPKHVFSFLSTKFFKAGIWRMRGRHW